MQMHLPHIIYEITDLYEIRLMRELVFIGFHGKPLGIRILSPDKWEADTWFPRGNASSVRQPDTIIILHISEIYQPFLKYNTQRPSTSRKLKHGDLTEEC